MVEKMRVVIITGMSGAGKTVAVHSLEDLGYFVFDNMLPNLAEKFVDVMEKASQFNKVAMVMDSRSQRFYDAAVQEYVMKSPLAKEFYAHLRSLLETAMPGYIHEGKSSLTIAIGCTGGQHRSVTIANKIATDLKADGYQVNIHHRDVDKAK